MTSDGQTPLMQQYLRFKALHPDKIVFFRMGDFYEMFGDDAVEAAPILGIALTSRSVDKSSAIPLCGIPYHAVDKYLPRLIEAGRKVVICEQVEDPKLARGLVKRDVVEIVTPGTSTLETALEPSHNSYLAAVCGDRRTMALARLELSTGEFSVTEGEPETILDLLQLLPPKELLITAENGEESVSRSLPVNGAVGVVTRLEPFYFDARLAEQNLCRFFGVTTLEGFGVGDLRLGVAAAGAILRYLQDNKQNRLEHITSLKVGAVETRMMLDAATVRNLELFTNLSAGVERHSFYWAVNRTVTAAGARRLRRTIAAPFLDKDNIDRRLTAVAELTGRADISDRLAERFKVFPDLERLAGRLGMGKANPRTLMAIRDAIGISRVVRETLDDCTADLVTEMIRAIPDLHDVAELIGTAIRDDAPQVTTAGGIFKAGYSPELDDLNLSIKDARAYIAGLAAAEREKTGIPTLKVGFNKVFGYYIEVTRPHIDKVPADYIRKQTLVNAERYITETMKDKESLILAAEDKINRLEEELFDRLCHDISGRLPEMMLLADILAELDVLNGFAVLARQERYVRPAIGTERNLRITQGRHPVISQILGPGNFVANDLALDENDTAMIILTGPNMSGKSTWLRQTALIVILAQMGSFVPAESAEIGLVDRIFTRVGAADSLTRGQSTFLVEMVETANILHNQSERSLILLDEIGRGTSTFDGLAVAWAVAETIHDHPAGTPRTLFATHYHEMTGLAAIYPRIRNFQVTVKKYGKEIIFLHQVLPGGCDDSYGIEVARLAGLPRETIKRAHEIVRLLESGKFAKSELARGLHARLNQPSLFDGEGGREESRIERELRQLQVENLTPLQALELLAAWKKDVDDE